MPHTGQNTKDELKAAAEKATPGPWSADRPDAEGAHWEVAAHDGSDWELFVADCRIGANNAHYIALANPATILALLAENEALREALQALWPANLGDLPAHLPDDFVFPLDVTAGELRAARSALNTEGRS